MVTYIDNIIDLAEAIQSGKRVEVAHVNDNDWGELTTFDYFDIEVYQYRAVEQK